MIAYQTFMVIFFWNRTEANNFHHCITTKTSSTRLIIILQDTSSLPPACSHIWCLNINNLQTKIESWLCSDAVKTWQRRAKAKPSPVSALTALVSDHISLQSHAALMGGGSLLSLMGSKSAHPREQLLTRSHWRLHWEQKIICEVKSAYAGGAISGRKKVLFNLVHNPPDNCERVWHSERYVQNICTEKRE